MVVTAQDAAAARRVDDRGNKDVSSFLKTKEDEMTQFATAALRGGLESRSEATQRGALGRPEQAGEEGLEAGLRRRCRYQLCVTLEVPGQVGRVDGGKFVVSFAIQSDGVSVVETLGPVAAHAIDGAGSAVAAGGVGVGGDSDDLKLSSRQAGIELLLAACLSNVQGPKQ